VDRGARVAREYSADFAFARPTRRGEEHSAVFTLTRLRAADGARLRVAALQATPA
jgi:hypothetical protein